MLFHSPFLDVLTRLSPDHLVCEEKGKKLTASELREKSLSLAAYLFSRGLRKGDHVLLACEGGTEFLILFFALIHLRVKTALVDPHMGRQRYWSKVKQFKPRWAFIDSRLLLLQEHPVIRFLYLKFGKNPFYIPYSNSYTVFATGYKLLLFQKHFRIKYNIPSPATFIFEEADPNDELVLVYTSGTLEEPKAVVHTVKSLYSSLAAIASLFTSSVNASIVTHLPHFALIGMMTGFRTLFWKEKMSPEQRLAFIRKHGITTLFGPSAEYLELMEEVRKKGEALPSCLTHLVLGSAPVLKPFLQELRKLTKAKITCLYGMTENLVVAAVDGDEKLAYTGIGDLVGAPLKNLEYIINGDGELCITSGLLFKRYFHEAERPDYHCTGDLVFEDKEGRLVMMGRKKNMIIRGNKNIYPGLYEGTICGIKGVREVVMLGVYNHRKHDEEVVLVVEGEVHLTEKEIRQALKQGPLAIDKDALPDHIVFMNIPKCGRQRKTDKNKILESIKPLLP